jgi:hypothetical protein
MGLDDDFAEGLGAFLAIQSGMGHVTGISLYFFNRTNVFIDIIKGRAALSMFSPGWRYKN